MRLCICIPLLYRNTQSHPRGLFPRQNPVFLLSATLCYPTATATIILIMPSPQRFSPACPPRKPLHERSDSHTNERTAPTVRIIGDPHARIYASSPFPSLPAHILSPKRTDTGSQGLVFEDDEEDVSDQDGSKLRPGHEVFAASPSMSGGSKDKEVAAVSNENESRFRFSTAEAALPRSSLYPSAPAQQSSSSSSSTVPDFPVDSASFAQEMQSTHGGERISDESIQLPNVPRRGEALGSHRHTQDFSLTPLRSSMPSKSSDTSLSSSGSTGTVIITRSQGRPARGSYSAFPPTNRPTSTRSGSSQSTSRKLASHGSDEDFSVVSTGSLRSPALSSYSTSDPGRNSSIAAARLPAAVQSGAYIQYPVLRPPTTSGSWAESIASPVPRPLRVVNRDVERWNPHLSTVHSEDADDRHSGSMWRQDSGGTSGRSSFPSNSFSDRSDMPLAPRPAQVRRSRDYSGSTIRVVKESNDNLTALPPIPGSRDSAVYSVVSRNSFRRRSRRNTLQTRPSSRGSFLRDGIPAWARYTRRHRILCLRVGNIADWDYRSYYARHGSSMDLGSRPQTSASVSNENNFTGISRPRNRHHHTNTLSRNRNSFGINTGGYDNIIAEIHERPRPTVSQVWSPHLWQDRRNTSKRRSMFKAPTIDEQAEGHALTRRNVQILLFAIGFIFPFGMITSSFMQQHWDFIMEMKTILIRFNVSMVCCLLPPPSPQTTFCSQSP